MSEYEPGTVAAIRDGYGDEWRALKDEKGWASLLPGIGWVADSDVTDVRPLVVIDPEDREQTARLADAFCDARWSHLPGSDECDPLTRSSMREALAAYLKPPKPPEPTGLGAVVEDAEGRRWVRTENVPAWYATGHGIEFWDAVNAVRVLSEGVQ